MWRLLIFYLAATTCAKPNDPLSQEFIDIVNRKAKTWRAGQNFPNKTSLSFLRGLMGMRPDAINFRLPLRSLQDEDEDEFSQDLPETFDSREHWPNCPTISEMFDQGNCGSCWAVGAATAMSDRYCIHSNAKKHFRFSVQELVDCCPSCGYGCNGGYPHKAWMHWEIYGLVSGGPYGSNHGCKPYEIPPNSLNKPVTPKAPKCERKCQRDFSVDYWKDLRYGNSAYSVPNHERCIRKEIFRNGPVEAGFTVYEDFIDYKDGVYQHVHGSKGGGHAVRVIGWGTENGTPYWLIANSWGTTWGDKGYFKILRGQNHCGIEEYIIAGIPKYSRAALQ